MRPIIVSQTGAGNSAPAVLNIHGRPEVGLQVVVNGTVNYTVQQTLDDPADAGATWFDHPDSALVATAANAQSNYAYVPRAVRVKVNSGAGTATLTIIQAGMTG